MSIDNTQRGIADPFGYQVALNRAVAEYMVSEGKSQTDLADILGLKQASVSRRLNGSSPWTLGDVALLVDAGVLTGSIMELS
ncbi:helix-turn-helix domain-containing protein [Actinomyces sp.]|uniref:helix-turn-helix domain-containing protein n=1 Tax=Actinomyces sp. TaxID=29317 RepID=UPI0029140BA7|nr:helix-turn-helix domain-containing protein [Actinomyces sp.]MDU6757750.1 helix-turn-helix domain-containing protein [Actinomyces sp.]